MGENFPGLADRYETWFINNKELFQSELALLKDMLPNFERGLEIGVGTGIFAQALGYQRGWSPLKRWPLEPNKGVFRYIEERARTFVLKIKALIC